MWWHRAKHCLAYGEERINCERVPGKVESEGIFLTAHPRRVQSATRQLQLIAGILTHAVTHGHSDHVGVLEAVTKQYPDAQVFFHEEEAPYLTGLP